MGLGDSRRPPRRGCHAHARRGRRSRVGRRRRAAPARAARADLATPHGGLAPRAATRAPAQGGLGAPTRDPGDLAGQPGRSALPGRLARSPDVRPACPRARPRDGARPPGAHRPARAGAGGSPRRARCAIARGAAALRRGTRPWGPGSSRGRHGSLRWGHDVVARSARDAPGGVAPAPLAPASGDRAAAGLRPHRALRGLAGPDRPGRPSTRAPGPSRASRPSRRPRARAYHVARRHRGARRLPGMGGGGGSPGPARARCGRRARRAGGRRAARHRRRGQATLRTRHARGGGGNAWLARSRPALRHAGGTPRLARAPVRHTTRGSQAPPDRGPAHGARAA